MQNLQNELIELLKTQDNLVIDGQLNKNKIIELGLKVEPQLIGLLIKNPTFKKHFFTEVESVLVFDKIKFQRFVNNKSFLPDSYTAFKNKIGLAINDDTTDNFIKAKNDVVLAWPHKDCVLEGGQTKEDQKRNEIFWNETLAPDNVDRLLDAKVFTNFKKYDKDGEHKVNELKGDENLILKGNNLLVLSSLIKNHRGQFDFIYADPPYNTKGSGDTFAYNNTFNESTWLTFMKNRLEKAKELLKEDGVICLTIDDYEAPKVWILMEEIFGYENHLGTAVIRINPGGRKSKRRLAVQHEYAIFFAKNHSTKVAKIYVSPEDKNHSYKQDDNGNWYEERNLRKEGQDSLAKPDSERFYPIYFDPLTGKISSKEKLTIEILPIDTKGQKRIWRRAKNDIDKLVDGGMIFHKKTKYGDQLYFKFLGGLEGETPKSFWGDAKYSASEHGTNELEKIMGESDTFSFPKSIHAIKDCIKVGTDKKNAQILDFFSGSGTTAQAVIELNIEDKGERKFVLAEQMDYVEKVTVKRVQKVIEKSNLDFQFVYAELLEYNQKYISKIQGAKTKEDILKVWKEMDDKAFLSFQFNKDIFNERLDAFKTGSLETMQQYLIEILDKNQLYVNFSEIEDESFAVSKEDKSLNYSFYKANN
jgi:adenine-specific DNA-methyltransferase